MIKFTLQFAKKVLFTTCLLTLTLTQLVSQTSHPELEKLGTYPCGKQPKQVLFSPDSKYILLPLLDDTGFDIFSVSERKIIKRINPPESNQLGFAEGLFIPEKKAFFVSQMTTGNIHEYSYPDFTYRRTISTEGTWCKFMVYSPENNIIAVSNWVSNNLSIIDYDTGKVIKKISTGAAPRGMAFTEKGSTLISLSFDDGVIEKFNVSDGKRLAKIYIENAAMRHIVVDSVEKYAYISDMYHRSILKVDLATFTIVKQMKVFNNPNTIDLLDDNHLFVSCRGPNNPQDYTLRSLVNGQIYIIDTASMTECSSFEGGNQPTGLDVSPDGKLLCFSNFQDANIEIYLIK